MPGNPGRLSFDQSCGVVCVIGIHQASGISVLGLAEKLLRGTPCNRISERQEFLKDSRTQVFRRRVFPAPKCDA